jgi:CHAT domain-containing protein
MSTIHNLELLERLAQIHSRNAECCHSLREIAMRAPQKFGEKFREIDAWLKNSKSDQPLDEAKEKLDKHGYAVYKLAVDLDPLRDLLCAQPSLAEVDIEQLIDYACIADVTPDPDPALMLSSKDALFMKVLGRILQQIPSTPDELFAENLAALVEIWLEYPFLLEPLYHLADLYGWSDHLRSLQGILESQDISDEHLKTLPEPARPAAQTLVHAIQEHERSEHDKKVDQIQQANQAAASGQATQLAPIPSKPPLRAFLFKADGVGITTIQRQEVILFQQVAGTLDDFVKSIQQESWAEFTSKQKSKAIAKELVRQGLISKESSQGVQNRIARRIVAAQHYFDLREFAKFNALSTAWPELSAELVNNRGRFLLFESSMLDLENLATEAKGDDELVRMLKRYQDNGPLFHFLQLLPYFNGLSRQKAKEMSHVAASLPQAETAKVVIADKSEAVAPPVSSALPEADIQHSLKILIQREGGNGSEQGERQEEETRYVVTVGMAEIGSRQVEAPINLSRQQVLWYMDSIQRVVNFRSGYTDVRNLGMVKAESRAPVPGAQKFLSASLKEIGDRLYTTFFVDEVADLIRTVLSQFSKVRFVLQLDAPELWALPWECLYLAEFRLPVALISKYSLVRYLAFPYLANRAPWRGKVRILAIYSSPVEMAPLKLAEEERALADVFRSLPSVEVRQVQHISIGQLQSEIRNFAPHIIHYGGHGGFSEDRKEGALIFEDEDNPRKSRLLFASQFSTICRASDVSLILLNACDTGTSDINDAITSVAGTLVADGVPVVIAATRRVDDIQAIIFVREFYRAMVDGYAIEAALAEARKRINAQEGDWSIFAIFANTMDLEQYKLILEQK